MSEKYVANSESVQSLAKDIEDFIKAVLNSPI